MKLFDIKEYFDDYDKNKLQELVNKLNRDGYVIELEKDSNNDYFISDKAIEDWNEETTEFLSNNGYLGGVLLSTGKYYGHYGNCIALFDSTETDSNKVIKIINSMV